MRKLNPYAHLLLLCGLIASHALIVVLSPHDLNWRLDLSSGPLFFASLDTRSGSTVAHLVGLLENEDYEVCLDYLLAELGKEQVAFLLSHLLKHPKLHPIVFPLHLFCYNREFNAALGPFIEEYRPGHSLRYDRLMFLRHLDVVATDSQIERLRGVPKMEDREINSAFTRPTLLRRLEQLGPLLAAIAFLHDAIQEHTVRRLVSQWGPLIKALPKGDARNAFLAFGDQESWSASYSRLDGLVSKELETLPARRVMWRGKLLLCALSHKHTSMDDKYVMLEDFLTSGSIKDVDPFFSKLLKVVMGRQEMFLDATSYPHLQPVMDRLDRRAPFALHFWGNLEAHILWWRARLRTVMRVQPFDIPCEYGICSSKALIEWWDAQASPTSGVLFDVSTFRPIRVHGVRPGENESSVFVCASWTELLEVIANRVEVLFEMAMRKDNGPFSLTLITARTIACNLLYRSKVHFASFPQWFEWVHFDQQNLDLDESPMSSVAQALKSLSMDGIPMFLLQPQSISAVVSPAPLRHPFYPKTGPIITLGVLLAIYAYTLDETQLGSPGYLIILAAAIWGLALYWRG